MSKKIKIGAREIKLDAAEDEPMAQAAADALKQNADDLAAKLGPLEAALAKATEELAALKGAPPPMAADEAQVPEEMQDRITATRAPALEAARADARLVLGATADLAGKTLGALKGLVVASLDPGVKLDGLSAAELDGRYRAADAATKRAAQPGAAAPPPARNDALAQAHAAAVPVAHTDSDDPGAAMEARREARRLAKQKGL